MSNNLDVHARDGSWLDAVGCCRVCDGEIPYGHTWDCDLGKLQERLRVLESLLRRCEQGFGAFIMGRRMGRKERDKLLVDIRKELHGC